MKRIWSYKIVRILLKGVVVFFAIIGLILTMGYFAVKLHLTNDPGVVDKNDRYFQEIKDRYGRSSDKDTASVNYSEARFLNNLSVLSKFYPANAYYINNAYYKSHNLKLARRMIDAVEMHLQDNAGYHAEVSKFEESKQLKQAQPKSESVFEWMNISEWQDFKLAVAKDKQLIDSAALVTGVEPRLIVAVLVGEQIRLFNSSREAYKKWIGPLKILSVESTFSLGVTGIKIPTALMIEKNLSDHTSPFYLGQKYEHLLNFKTNNVAQERFDRLTSYKNHYYSYLYAALNVKQIKVQWERAGFPVSERPEILATLYNIGYEVSVPKENPEVGGSSINIKGKTYSFGAVAYEFYYSGELFELFPFKNAKFDYTDV